MKHRRPQPTRSREIIAPLECHSYADVWSVFEASSGEATGALYAALRERGPIGEIALNLFRACKTSERAKSYRGGNRDGSFRSQSYQTKEWALSNIIESLMTIDEAEGIVWGWGVDAEAVRRSDPHKWVIYFQLPTGQVSFHLGFRGKGPDFPGTWDRAIGTGPERVCRFCAKVLGFDPGVPRDPYVEPKQQEIEL